jgi:hypothetical protein
MSDFLSRIAGGSRLARQEDMKPIRATILAAAMPFLLVPAAAVAQTPGASNSGRVSLQAAAGVTVKYPGHTVSAGLGFSPVSRLDLSVAAERLHVPTSEQRSGDNSFGVTRGGTLTFVSGEIRISLFPPDRVSPFVLAGVGAGISRPNVNARFPVAVENDLRVVYLGGGLRVPLNRGLSLVADARALLGVEDADGIVGVWPVRAGVIWRF